MIKIKNQLSLLFIAVPSKIYKYLKSMFFSYKYIIGKL